MTFGNSGDTSRVAFELFPESTYGVLPVTPAMAAMRLTGETLKQSTTTDRENELRGDRQPGQPTRTNANVAGDTNHLLSYTALDVQIEAALMSAVWTAAAAVVAAHLTLTMGTLTASPAAVGIIGAGDDAFIGFNDGDVVLISGFAGAANNGLFRATVESSNSPTVEFDELRLVGLTTPVIEANPGGGGIDITVPSYAENGITNRSFTGRRRYTDIAKVSVFTGLAIDGWSLQINAQGNVESNFTWLGKLESSVDIAGATVVAAPTFKPFSGVDNIQGILENGEVIELRDLSIALVNGLRERNIIGTLGPNDLGVSTLGLSGGMEFYYDAGAEAIYDRYLGFTSSQLAITFADALGQGYWMDVGDINFDDGQRNAPQGDDDVLGTMSWQANREVLTDRTFRVYRTAGIPV